MPGPSSRRARSPTGVDLTLLDARALAAYVAGLFAVHLLFVATGRRTDQVLLPAVGMLGGLGLLLMQRLPQSLVTQSFGDAEFSLGQVQLGWLLLALAIVAVVGTVVRSDAWLRLYKYTWAAIGIALLLLVFLFGREVNGVRLVLAIGPVAGQPSEFLKVILVVFLAGYLAENRALLIEESTRVGPLRLPPMPYLAPMVAMWAIALGIVVVQRDLGAALLFFAVFLGLLYVATGRRSYVVLGLILFVVGRSPCTSCSPMCGRASTSGSTRSRTRRTRATRSSARCMRSGGAGCWATGLGAGLPTVGNEPAIPAIHTDFPLAALGEELGLIGLLAVLGIYLVVIERGLRIAAAARRRVPGAARGRPRDGRRGPGVHHRGGEPEARPADRASHCRSSPTAARRSSRTRVIVGLLLALSDRGVEPPPPPRPRGRLRRAMGRVTGRGAAPANARGGGAAG